MTSEPEIYGNSGLDLRGLPFRLSETNSTIVRDVRALHCQCALSLLSRLGFPVVELGLGPGVQKNLRFFSAGGDDYVREQRLFRMGTRQMFVAGFDIREAPFAWTAEQGKPVNNPVFRDTGASKNRVEDEFPWYSVYGFGYIKQYYRGIDFDKLDRGEAEYTQFLEELRKIDPDAFAQTKQPQIRP